MYGLFSVCPIFPINDNIVQFALWHAHAPVYWGAGAIIDCMCSVDGAKDIGRRS